MPMPMRFSTTARMPPPTPLWRDPHPDGELAGAVVHAAGQHNGLGHLDSVFVNEPFSCLRMPASVGQHQPRPARLSAVTLKEHIRV